MTLTVIVIIVLDCVVSVFSAGAYSATFMAWVTDVTDVGNRGRADRTARASSTGAGLIVTWLVATIVVLALELVVRGTAVQIIFRRAPFALSSFAFRSSRSECL